MVGLSGGKDSLALVDLLAGRQRYGKIGFDLAAMHVKFSSVPYESDTEFLNDFCKKRNIPFFLIETDLPESADLTNSPCFVCSWNRRKLLFEKSQELGYSKLAFGHHMDDAVETLLLNMTFQGNLGSLPASLKMFGDQLEIIRPLLLLTNEELAEYARRKGFPSEKKRCLFEKESKRNSVRQLVQELKKLNPTACRTIFTAMHHIHPDYFPSTD